MRIATVVSVSSVLAVSSLVGCNGPSPSAGSVAVAKSRVKLEMSIAEVKAALGNRTFLDERQTRGARGRNLWILSYDYEDGGLVLGFEDGLLKHSRVMPSRKAMEEAARDRISPP